MVDTTRNRSGVLAQFLRAALKDVDDSTGMSGTGRIVVRADQFHNALASIGAVADELEAIAVAPDPEGVR